MEARNWTHLGRTVAFDNCIFENIVTPVWMFGDAVSCLKHLVLSSGRWGIRTAANCHGSKALLGAFANLATFSFVMSARLLVCPVRMYQRSCH